MSGAAGRVAAIAAQDLRFALRTLRTRPGFSLLAVVVLGIGIGLATAIYGVVEGVLLRPLPVRAQDEIVVLSATTRDRRLPHVPLTLAQTRAYLAAAKTLQAVAYFDYHGTYKQVAHTGGGDGVWNLSQAYVSGGYLDVLGVRPVLGRSLRPSDNVAGAAPVTVISYAAWQRRFNGDPSVIGKTVTLVRDNTPLTIVGVLPKSFDIPLGSDSWLPITPLFKDPGSDTLFASMDLVGRLRTGTSASAARSEFDAFLAHVPGLGTLQLTGVAHSLLEEIVGNVRVPLLIFSAAAALLLLMACANVANLLLARGLGRSPEIALRAALGAGSGRIIAQLLTESAILALAGAALGALIADTAVRALVAVAPPDLPRLAEIGIDGATMAMAIAIGAASIILFGVAPAVASARGGVWHVLRAGTHQLTASRRLRFATDALVVVQMALALLVLSAAALLGRTLLNLERVRLGLDPTHVLVAELALPPTIADTSVHWLPFLDRVTERLAQVPGVRAVSPVMSEPLEGHGVDGMVSAEGDVPTRARARQFQSLELASAGYFAALGIPIVAGRTIDDRDRERAPLVVVISDGVARELWPGVSARDVIGKRLHGFGDTAFRTVVGVVADTRYRELQQTRSAVYFPLHQNPLQMPPSYLAVRTAGDPAAAAAAVRMVMADVDPTVAIAATATYDDLMEKPLAAPRLYALLLGLFAAAAVTLAAVGLYGILATLVRLRVRELAVRRALGASDAELRWSVVRRGLALAVIGSAVGIALSLITNRLLAATLFEVRPLDVGMMAVAVVSLIAISALACLIPARQATRVDPITALRAAD